MRASFFSFRLFRFLSSILCTHHWSVKNILYWAYKRAKIHNFFSWFTQNLNAHEFIKHLNMNERKQQYRQNEGKLLREKEKESLNKLKLECNRHDTSRNRNEYHPSSYANRQIDFLLVFRQTTLNENIHTESIAMASIVFMSVDT